MLRAENRIQTQIQTFDLLGSNKASDHVLFLSPEFSQLPNGSFGDLEMKDLALDIFLSQKLHACKIRSKVDLTFF